MKTAQQRTILTDALESNKKYALKCSLSAQILNLDWGLTEITREYTRKGYDSPLRAHTSKLPYPLPYPDFGKA